MTGIVGSGDQPSMNCTTRWLAVLALFGPLVACDPGSKEIGATVGDSSSGVTTDAPVESTGVDLSGTTEETTGGVDETTGGETTGGETTSVCDPLAEACPDANETAQECEPNAANDGWACVPQNAGTSPGYGDECWPTDSPAIACTGETICLPVEGLGVAGCDGGEGGGCCTQLCHVDGDGTECPDEDQVCVPYYDLAPAGYEHVGVCRIP